MAGRVNYKAVIPGESSPRMAQDPGRPSLSVSNQDSRLAEGTSDVGAVRGRSTTLRFGLKYKCQSLHITCTHYIYYIYFEMKREKSIFRNIYNIYKKLITLIVS